MIVGVRTLEVTVRYAADTVEQLNLLGPELQRRIYAALPKHRLQLSDGSTVELHNVTVSRP